MKLYNPQEANQFVFAVVAKNARDGTPPDYKACGSESIEACERHIDSKAMRNAYPHCMGRYDELGRYCVYKPALEGVAPGKFVLHPLAAEEKKVYDRELSYR